MSLRRHLAGGLDPVALAGRIGLDCDPWQADVLRARDQRLLLNIHRQGGKSTVAAVLAVHEAIFSPESLVLLVSPSQRQSQELFRRCLTLYRSLGRPVAPEAENALSLSLENGSRVVSLPGDERTVRGYSNVRLLVIDEASRVDDELMSALRPMLAVSAGRLVAMSTPWGRRGWFWEGTKSSEFRTITVPATQCPRIKPEFLAAERQALGDLKFRAEYLCEFSDLAGRMFASDDIAAVFAAGQLGAIPPGALFSGLQPERSGLHVAAPLAVVVSDWCRGTGNEGRHLWRVDQCVLCGDTRPTAINQEAAL